MNKNMSNEDFEMCKKDEEIEELKHQKQNLENNIYDSIMNIKGTLTKEKVIDIVKEVLKSNE